jgi:hypothetical protein
VEQQFAVAARHVIHPVAALPGRDVRPDQPRLAPLDARVRLGKVHLAGADRLDLGAGQDETGFDRVFDRVLVAGPPVDGQV